MKSIEDRARKYAESISSDNETRQIIRYTAYQIGARDEHKELTRWCSCNTPPTHSHVVLIKDKYGCYVLGRFHNGEWSSGAWQGDERFWREIHE